MSAALKLEHTPASSLIANGLIDAEGRSLVYWPTEVSQFLLAILTSDDLTETNHVILSTEAGHALRLTLIKFEKNYRGGGLHWAQYRSEDTNANIESELRKLPELKRWNPQHANGEPIKLPSGRMQIRAARFDLNDRLPISAKTFGTRFPYNLSVQNVSKSGMLIAGDGEAPPFNNGTILEMTIDPQGSQFAEPVRCLAKVVRSETNHLNQKIARFAVQLIELDPSINTVWCDYIDNVERRLAMASV